MSHGGRGFNSPASGAGGAPSGAAGGDLSGTYPDPTVAAGAVTLAKMANLATDRLIGRTTAGTGVPEAVAFTDAGQAMVAAATATAQTALLDAATVSTAGISKVRASKDVYFLRQAAGSATAWSAMPAATTELFGSTLYRLQTDLTNYTQVRIHSRQNAAAVAGAKLGLQYSLDAGSTWVFMDGTADGDLAAETPQVTLQTSAALVTSAYMTMTAAACADVLLRMIGDDGNAVANPTFSELRAEFR